MEPRIQYAKTSDGVNIAYCAEGEGPPLVACGVLFESFSKDHLFPIRSRAFQDIGQGRKMVRYDPRGVGFSQRGVDDLSIEGHVKDLEAVVQAIGAPLSLLGWFASVPRVLLFASRHPDQVQKLVLIDGYTRQLDLQSRDVQRALADMARLDLKPVAQALAPRSWVAGADEAWAQAYLESTTGDEAARAMLSYLDMDVTSVLGDVQVPTLVLHNPDSENVSFEFGQRIAAGIPDATLIPIPGLSVEPEALASAVDSFLPKRSSGRSEATSTRPAPESGFRTVLFTDVEGSTALTQRLGDAKARELLREHERLMREALKTHGGAEVKTMGDGFMASFSSATKALECAIAMQRAFAEHNEDAEEPINVRIGLNAGEPIAEDDDLFGMAVNLAARICAHAEAGQILAPIVVRELAAGKQFMFADLGETELRGFEDPVRLYELRWREAG